MLSSQSQQQDGGMSSQSQQQDGGNGLRPTYSALSEAEQTVVNLLKTGNLNRVETIQKLAQLPIVCSNGKTKFVGIKEMVKNETLSGFVARLIEVFLDATYSTNAGNPKKYITKQRMLKSIPCVQERFNDIYDLCNATVLSPELVNCYRQVKTHLEVLYDEALKEKQFRAATVEAQAADRETTTVHIQANALDAAARVAEVINDDGAAPGITEVQTIEEGVPIRSVPSVAQPAAPTQTLPELVSLKDCPGFYLDELSLILIKQGQFGIGRGIKTRARASTYKAAGCHDQFFVVYLRNKAVTDQFGLLLLEELLFALIDAMSIYLFGHSCRTLEPGTTQVMDHLEKTLIYALNNHTDAATYGWHESPTGFCFDQTEDDDSDDSTSEQQQQQRRTAVARSSSATAASSSSSSESPPCFGFDQTEDDDSASEQQQQQRRTAVASSSSATAASSSSSESPPDYIASIVAVMQTAEARKGWKLAQYKTRRSKSEYGNETFIAINHRGQKMAPMYRACQMYIASLGVDGITAMMNLFDVGHRGTRRKRRRRNNRRKAPRKEHSENASGGEESVEAGVPAEDMSDEMWQEKLTSELNSDQTEMPILSRASSRNWFEKQHSMQFVSLLRTGFGNVLTHEDIKDVANTMLKVFRLGQNNQNESYEQERNNIPRAIRATVASSVLWYYIIGQLAEEETSNMLLAVVRFLNRAIVD